MAEGAADRSAFAEATADLVTFAEAGRIGWRLDKHYSLPPANTVAFRIRY